jgi:hypothetical protein
MLTCLQLMIGLWGPMGRSRVHSLRVHLPLALPMQLVVTWWIGAVLQALCC